MIWVFPDNRFPELCSGKYFILAKAYFSDCIVSSVLIEACRRTGYKSCMALLKSADKYSAARLEAALSFTPSPSLKSVQAILKSGQDRLPDEHTDESSTRPSQYSFTRGAEYYSRRDK